MKHIDDPTLTKRLEAKLSDQPAFKEARSYAYRSPPLLSMWSRRQLERKKLVAAADDKHRDDVLCLSYNVGNSAPGAGGRRGPIFSFFFDADSHELIGTDKGSWRV